MNSEIDINSGQNINLSSRPKIQIPKSTLENFVEVGSVSGVLLEIYLIGRFWSILPDRIPMHYNFAGHVDGWGGKGTLIILPFVTIFMYAMLTLFERFPNIYNYPFPLTQKNVRTQYGLARGLLIWLKFEVVWLFAFLVWKTIQVAIGQASSLGPKFIFVFLGVLFGTIITYSYLAYKSK
jgi:hypothetical protein